MLSALTLTALARRATPDQQRESAACRPKSAARMPPRPILLMEVHLSSPGPFHAHPHWDWFHLAVQMHKPARPESLVNPWLNSPISFVPPARSEVITARFRSDLRPDLLPQRRIVSTPVGPQRRAQETVRDSWLGMLPQIREKIIPILLTLFAGAPADQATTESRVQLLRSEQQWILIRCLGRLVARPSMPHFLTFDIAKRLQASRIWHPRCILLSTLRALC